ncbi:MAG: hypothetical protein L0Y38_01030, partial [Methylococcaceae bacterium]|nr:hypothetical protein [Methylococcaceae bacterium]
GCQGQVEIDSAEYRGPSSRSKSGIVFRAGKRPSKEIDALRRRPKVEFETGLRNVKIAVPRASFGVSMDVVETGLRMGMEKPVQVQGRRFQNTAPAEAVREVSCGFLAPGLHDIQPTLQSFYSFQQPVVSNVLFGSHPGKMSDLLDNRRLPRFQSGDP